MKKKLLFISGNFDNGGAERSLANLFQLLDYSRYDVDLILLKERGRLLAQLPKEVNLISDLPQLHFLYDDSIKHAFNIRHPYLSFIHIFGTLFSKIQCGVGHRKVHYRWQNYYSKAIPRIEKEYDTAISYLEGEPMLLLVDKVCAKKKIAWIHTDYSKMDSDPEQDKKYFEKLDHVVGVSKLCVEILQNQFPDMKEKFIELPNLTSSEILKNKAKEFYPQEFEADRLKLICVGRLIPLKGFDMAIQAASILKKKGIDFQWFILGNGELWDSLHEQIEQHDVADCFHFLGIRDNPYAYMVNADIIIQTSRFEGKSMVLDEAKILGVPIVSTNYSTVYDQVHENEGIIVDMTPEAIAAGIETMIQEKKQYRAYLCSRTYGNENEIDKYYAVLE